MGKEQNEELKKHGFYFSVPHGNSMFPMLRGGKDIALIRVPEKEPVRYDLVLYNRSEDVGVIHRIIKKKDGIFIIMGDNCYQKEYVRPEQIAGIVTSFCRNGKWHSVNEKGYRLYVKIHTDLYFIRRPFLFVRDKIKKIIYR